MKNPHTRPYSRMGKEKLILRDYLAMDRTMLANERTFLAYIRTTLTLLIGGVGLIKFFEDDPTIIWLGITFIVASIPIFFIGLYRFMNKKKDIERSIG